MSIKQYFCLWLPQLLVIWLGLSVCAYAGGGPENVLLVVNANSNDSKEVANHYVRLRNLPASNVLYLDYTGNLERIDGEAFRQKILRPILEAIQSRGLGLQIDIIAYSCDFPWQINLSGDLPEGTKIPSQRKPFASLTGATYLWQFAILKNPGIVLLDSNWYVPEPDDTNLARCRKLKATPSHAFRSRYAWKKGGVRANDLKSGRRYFLSTMLGVTTGRGNTTEEVIGSLRRAVLSEVTPPSGAFYFAKNSNVRSTTRDACYPAAIAALGRLGAKGVMVKGNTPKGAKDIAGMMLGASKLDLRGLEIQPGAICEHLTSSGGDLREGAWQTPLTDLIRAGAAGTSGTVYEPLAIQAKFPLPSIHLHYRRGSSLAEAFYQSVASPYQLLIVGDPLCQPWANRPTMDVGGWPHNGENNRLPQETSNEQDQAKKEPSKGPTITPRVILSANDDAMPAKNQPKTFWELFIDGRLRMRLPSETSFGIRLESLGPGWHELRCVGFDPGPLEFQGRVLGSLQTDRFQKPPAEQEEPSIQPERLEPVRLTTQKIVVPLDGQVQLRATATGAGRIEIRQNWRIVGEIKGDSGMVELEASLLGRGPIRLQAVAQPEGAASVPIQIVVQ